jgi:pyrophosphate--fructose-6-phosphate 1-phosphotransferase
MGRSASHVALECALQTHVNVALIGEEVQEQGQTLRSVVAQIADVVLRRAKAGKNFGVVLVPEGLIEFIPEIRVLIKELNKILHGDRDFFEKIPTFTDKKEFVNKKLSKDSSYVFNYLPQRIQIQLLLDRDSHGNVQVSRIDTEQLLLEQVKEQMAEWEQSGQSDCEFQGQHGFLGYEGRCAVPSDFDADYTYALGQTAAALVAFGRTGIMSSVRNLTAPRSEWRAGGVPLVGMMQIEERKGKPTPVIAKALVQTEGAPFRRFAARRKEWEMGDDYVYPGPIQYFGPPELCGALTMTLLLEQGQA